ncbi:hypothetical protein [Blastomonas fulva]|uniref:hypothetical protein n=1 Tax=Blastomonas fulva TaxID=1550728 RepID=UPI003F6E977A
MSGESTLHIRLVECLERRVRERHATERGLLMLVDHHRYGSDRPHRVNGYCPDLFASDLPTTFEILGEAKTTPDLERPRSQAQIVAFLDHLSLRPGGWFYLCVPLLSVGRARNLLARLRSEQHAGVIAEVITLV